MSPPLQIPMLPELRSAVHRQLLPNASATTTQTHLNPGLIEDPKRKILELIGDRVDITDLDPFSTGEVRKLFDALSQVSFLFSSGAAPAAMKEMDALKQWAFEKDQDNRTFNAKLRESAEASKSSYLASPQPETAAAPENRGHDKPNPQETRKSTNYYKTCVKFLAPLIRQVVKNECVAADLLEQMRVFRAETDRPKSGIFGTNWVKPLHPDHLPELARNAFETQNLDFIGFLVEDVESFEKMTPVQFTAIRVHADIAAAQAGRDQQAQDLYAALALKLKNLQTLPATANSPATQVLFDLMHEMHLGAVGIDAWFANHQREFRDLPNPQKLVLCYSCFKILRPKEDPAAQRLWVYDEAAAVILSKLNEPMSLGRDELAKLEVTVPTASDPPPVTAVAAQFHPVSAEAGLSPTEFDLFLSKIKSGVLQGATFEGLLEQNQGRLSEAQLTEMKNNILKRGAGSESKHANAWRAYEEFMRRHGVTIEPDPS